MKIPKELNDKRSEVMAMIKKALVCFGEIQSRFPVEVRVEFDPRLIQLVSVENGDNHAFC